MPIVCSELIKKIEDFAPAFLAQDWDNIGLQIGSFDKPIKKVLISLDLTLEVLEEAINRNVDMVITHHPLIFKPIKKISGNDPISNIIIKLIKNDINLYCAHTNLDIAVGGTSDYISDMLGLSNSKPLSYTYKEKYLKLVVFTPKDHIDHLLNVMSDAGAGNIGNYSHCTFQSNGYGTFKPLEGSNPYIGELNTLEMVDEIKLESIVPQNILGRVLNKMLEAHPYEEVAYDLIPLKNDFGGYGFGRTGFLNTPLKLRQLALILKDKLKANAVKVIGDEKIDIRKIAICTGSGAEFIKEAINQNCDCYITGDIKYHEAQYALDSGLAIIDAGHFETENIICNRVKEYLQDVFKENSEEIQFIISEVNTNPFKIVY